uniref:F-box domain-containing protein n=1 Tax=Tetranychus urticae TaxID=32264 RepID=T1L4T2_TETUR
MLINELPDDCLLTIFDQFNDLHHLIACFKVCVKWSHLIAKRAKKVEYFRGFIHILINLLIEEIFIFRLLYLIDVASLSSLFPNLIVAEFSEKFQEKLKFEDIAVFVRKHEPLKGMITSCVAMEDCSDKLEMLAPECSELGILQERIRFRQFGIRDFCLVDFKSDARYRQNLERLQILINGSFLNGPVLEKLKVVVLSSYGFDLGNIFYGFQFLDSCPNLQSAHITINSRTVLVDETIKHECLQDLVIHCSSYKCPNLKHLALRRQGSMRDEHIEQLVHILPDLVIFDIRGCFGVTQRAVNYVQNYFERNGRSTKFYWKGNRHEIASDWPQLYTKRQEICQGFDFMERYFLEYRLASDV